MYQVEERAVPVEELMEAEEVFCTGTAVVVASVGSVTYKDRRLTFFSLSLSTIIIVLEHTKDKSERRINLLQSLTSMLRAILTTLVHGNCRIEFRTGAETACQRLYDILVGIQMGHIEDKYGWVVEIN